jgi:hypothetical protein
MYELNSFFQSLEIERNSVTNFFIVFSRFEYALKRAGYIKSNSKNNYNAEPNWDSFVSKNKKSFQLLQKDNDENNKLKEAIKYLRKFPPKKLVYKKVSNEDKNKELILEDIPPNKSEIHYLLSVIKTARNNLFHGEKSPSYLKETARDMELLNSSIIILEAWLKLDKGVNSLFFEKIPY